MDRLHIAPEWPEVSIWAHKLVISHQQPFPELVPGTKDQVCAWRIHNRVLTWRQRWYSQAMPRLLPPACALPGSRTNRIMSLINLLPYAPCQLSSWDISPAWLAFTCSVGREWSWVEGDRGELYAFLGMIMTPKAHGQQHCLYLLTELGSCLPKAHVASGNIPVPGKPHLLPDGSCPREG